MAPPVTRRLVESAALRVCLILLLAATLAQGIAHFAGFLPVERKVLVDFDAFHIAGQMYWEGSLNDAYSAAEMIKAQQRFSGAIGFMPWSYPPQFNFVAAGLALMPLGLSFAVFILLTFGAYLWVLRRLAGQFFFPVVLTIMPALMVNLKSGQNGFLTGALVGGVCLLLLGRRGLAGLPLGLMVIKPHLVLAMGVSVLVARRWAVVAWAAVVVIVTSGLATLAFGPQIWSAFLGGAAEASGFLKEGDYPLFRMTSLYAALETLGVPGRLALPLQGALAVAACAAVAVATIRLSDPRQVLAVALLGSLLVSPYGYDYDLTLLGVALALIAPDFLARAGDRDVLALVLMSWLATGSGLAVVTIFGSGDPASVLDRDTDYLSAGFYGYAGVLLVLARAFLRRPVLEARGALSS
jgi:hypothetical protein